MFKSATSLLATLALVAASFTFGGCGGSSHPAGSPHDSFGPGPGLVADADNLGLSRPPVPPATRGPSRVSACPCPNGDPAAFTICLAKHGVHLSAGDGKLTTCVQSASDKDELDRCLSEAVR